LIPTNKDALKAWLIDLSGNIAVSGAGIAFLDAQITRWRQTREKFVTVSSR